MPEKEFVVSTLVKLNEYSIALEHEGHEPRSEYDEDNPPGERRMVLHSSGKSAICSSLAGLREATELMGFPMLPLATKHPRQLASMICKLLRLGLPVIHDGYDWLSVEGEFRVRMADVIPEVVGNELRWFEVQWPSPHWNPDNTENPRVLLERRLTLDSFILTGERLGER